MLKDLEIKVCKNLEFLAEGLHKLMNLRILIIVKCSSLIDYKNQGSVLCGLCNLTTLNYLAMGGCLALVSIPKGILKIEDCPILESLHDGLSDLASLKDLFLRNCPMPRQWFHKKEGEEWSKILQIPRVYIDGEELQ
ncbi:hypothetical protein NE237_003337 [Protea cynaroides]|uniref:CC-NBS-LRR protein n=1 Tax=Protea cynaroides TaxID=273540 RepID=A0A9Q0KGM3_9MAGN|nr:hypothetical protein NE237_003337 [Protea cynaroides]